MDRRRPWQDDDVETSHLPRRQKTSHHDDARRFLPHDCYTIAWICALHIEMAAARAMLDEEHQAPVAFTNDSNTYSLGSIRGHNVVIACLPNAQYGTNNAANVLTNLTRTFRSVNLGLMVGIGGGVPSMADVRLGDIVVGTRVMQYDLGKIVEDGQIRRTAVPKTPHQTFGSAVSALRCEHELRPSYIPVILEDKLGNHPGYCRPALPDQLFPATYEHEASTPDCSRCDQSKLTPRRGRLSQDPSIHYGVIASGNQVMRSGTVRDNVARQLDAVCFEMEAAGLMDILPCLPIRGICDYSDSHKNKEWQRYAAATAAAYATELLALLPNAYGHRRPSHQSHLAQPTQWSDFPQSGPATVQDRAAGQNMSDDRRRNLLDSLKFDNIDSRKVDIRAAHAKTCQWFLSHPDYLAWLDPSRMKEHRGFLWIRGKPGAGKSTIMKFIYLRTKKARKTRGVIASFFFHARGEQLEKSVAGMYRSLLLQLLEGYPDLQAVLDDPDVVPRTQSGCPSLNILKDIFTASVSRLGSRPFTCFVDALDECDEQQVRAMVQDLEELADESTEKGQLLRICFSSRHYPYINIRHGIHLTLDGQPGHVNDLTNYVTSRLNIKDPKLVDELQGQILEKAAGVFLWVILVVEILNKENGRGRLALKKRLKDIPDQLSELFKDILRRDNQNMDQLLLCVLWILLAKRPLRPNEFYHALWSGLSPQGLVDDEVPDVTSQDSGDTITSCVVSYSKGLAEITKSNQPIVQFIHESVRDFLVKDKGLQEIWPAVGYDWECQGHDRLKQCCFVYMNYHMAPGSLSIHSPAAHEEHHDNDANNFPFLEYASHHVLLHSDGAELAISQENFLSDFPLSLWIPIYNQFERYQIRRYSSQAKLPYILADMGLARLVHKIPADEMHACYPEERYKYTLFAALANGHKDAFASILGLTSRIYNGGDITEGLSHRRNDPALKEFKPLTWAAQAGRKDIARLLLAKGADINEKDYKGKTPICEAILAGHKEVVRVLLERGADAEDTLTFASRDGHEEAVRMLVEGGADANSGGALAFASIGGHKEVVRVLLERGADANSAGVLTSASIRGHKEVVRVLLEGGADANSLVLGNKTALYHARQNGYTEIAQLLLDHGAEAD
ncbi:Pfs, NACHT and ankyrin domain protein [Colletotrichum navitas]|uniref:Pfs, NACHT and ankyrin domain protein n=1 Tax=Colletotrichum navitas TaxID=681940 RepID=A0AAD8PXC6_9PEZI|nr:Pfs, NACHT and ankyrin domain protein [Colletotrichum navitas]KAK1589671.1 Pfs, NACHT and ankyrin domain protein [Colletotrichum navitas]